MGGVNQNEKDLINKIYEAQAQWAMTNGDPKQAASLYIACKLYKKAIEIYEKEDYMDGLIEVCRIIDKEGNENVLSNCASQFKKSKEHGYAK